MLLLYASCTEAYNSASGFLLQYLTFDREMIDYITKAEAR